MNTLPPSRLNILLAEDNPVNQKVALLMLEKGGHIVTVVEDGELAVEAWRTGQFDMILMDVMMPKLNGIEATRQIRQAETRLGGHIPIVAITANAMQSDQEQCLGAGMDGYLAKPLSPNRLHQEIERAWLANSECQTIKPSEKDDLPILDHADAMERMGGSEALLRSLFDLFLNEYDNYLGNIDKAEASGNQADLIRAAHTLKGALATLSASRARKKAEELEQAAKAGEQPRYRPLIQELKQELASFKAVIART